MRLESLAADNARRQPGSTELAPAAATNFDKNPEGVVSLRSLLPLFFGADRSLNSFLIFFRSAKQASTFAIFLIGVDRRSSAAEFFL